MRHLENVTMLYLGLRHSCSDFVSARRLRSERFFVRPVLEEARERRGGGGLGLQGEV